MAGQEPYKVIDVFAGPGGLGEGFAAFGHGAGKSSFKLALSIEKDPTAHSTLLLRSFYRQFDPEGIPPEYWSYAKGEITKAKLFDFYPQQAKAAAEEAQCIELGKTPAHEVKNLINQRLNGSEKWVLVGGPPCHAYSLVGRARMRGTDPDFEKDVRHFLYREYLRIIADHRPPVFVMENVKGILSAQHSGKKIINSILSDLKKPDVAVNGRSSGLGYTIIDGCQKQRAIKLLHCHLFPAFAKGGFCRQHHRFLERSFFGFQNHEAGQYKVRAAASRYGLLFKSNLTITKKSCDMLFKGTSSTRFAVLARAQESCIQIRKATHD
ncbi:MAG: DNA cytosine methyltransferase [Gallionella sp.]|nr:DNA cytosine methyltransferase [Gallionella sp.]